MKSPKVKFAVLLPLMGTLAFAPAVACPQLALAEEAATQSSATVIKTGTWGSGKDSGQWSFFEDGSLLIEGSGYFDQLYMIASEVDLTQVKSLRFGEGIQKIVNYLEDEYYCENLSEVTIPTSLKVIGANAFKGSAIKTLVLPSTIEEFDASAVNDCNLLESITFLGQCPDNIRSSYYSGDTYSGKNVNVYHRAGDKSWNVAGKFMLGNFSWYTLDSDGQPIEDDYISPYYKVDMDIVTDDTSCFYWLSYQGKSSGHSFPFDIATSRTVTIHWEAMLDSDCSDSSFTFICKNTKGNSGKVIKKWSVATGDVLSGDEKIKLDEGSYVLEVVFTDSHSNNSEGSATVYRLSDFDFGDINSSVAHSGDIAWLATKGVSTGWQEKDGSYTFRPFNNVARADMAAFLYRLAGSPVYTLPSVSPFKDCNTSTPHYKEICWLADAGISKGWDVTGGKEFRPYETVARCDMAAFLYRMAGSPGYTESSSSSFNDVESSTPHYKEICWLADKGVSRGWEVADGLEFRPYTKVARADMAAFLRRMYDYQLIAQS